MYEVPVTLTLSLSNELPVTLSDKVPVTLTLSKNSLIPYPRWLKVVPSNCPTYTNFSSNLSSMST